MSRIGKRNVEIIMENDVVAVEKAVLNRVRPKDYVHLQIPLTTKKALLGRSEQADFHFPDTKISRSHALLEYDVETAQWTIKSQGLNGVWVNGSQIPKDTATPLKGQDFIQLGPEDYYVYQFDLVAQLGEPQPKRSRFDSVAEVLKQVPEFQNVSHIASQSEALKTLIASQNAKEAQLLQERQRLEERIRTQGQEQQKLLKEREEVHELLRSRTAALEAAFCAEKAKLEAKMVRSEMEQAEVVQEKAALEAKYQKDTADLSHKLQEEKVELERRIGVAEHRARDMRQSMSQLLASVEDLQGEKTRLEAQLEEERRKFEAVTQELQAKLAQEKCDLEAKWAKEKADLERELSEEKALLESQTRSESVLRQEKTEMEQRYQERNAALEAQLAEMQGTLEERANAECVRLGHQVFADLQQCISSNPIVVIEGRNAIEPFVNEVEDLRGMLEKVEEQKKQIETAVEAELECSICSELFIHATAPSCGHSFCEWCLNEWRKRKHDCPTCRLPILYTSRMRVLDNIVDTMVRNLPDDARQKRDILVRQRQEALSALRAFEAGVGAAPSRPAAVTARRRGGGTASRPVPPSTVTVPDEPPARRRRGAAVPVRPPRTAGPAPAAGFRPRNGEGSAPGLDATITLSSGSDSSSPNENYEDESDSSFSSDTEDYFDLEGDPNAYYGGYGRCFNCGSRGHWAPGCPFRFGL